MSFLDVPDFSQSGGFMAKKQYWNSVAAGNQAAPGNSASFAAAQAQNVREYAKSLYDSFTGLSAPETGMSGVAATTKGNVADILSSLDDISLATYEGWSGQTTVNNQKGGLFTKPTGTSGLSGSKGTGYMGLQSGFSSGILQMIADAKAQGISIGVTDGWRSYQAQVTAKKNKGSLAATPGRSNHGWGLAADLSFGNAAARQWAHDNAAKYGLTFPMSWESWHIEPIGITTVKGGKTLGTGNSSRSTTHSSQAAEQRSSRQTLR